MSRFRISKVQLSNFRCFADETIDLSTDIVAIYGRNGVGKTTIYDAIEFALFGSIFRLRDFDADVDYIGRIGTADDTRVRIDFESSTRPAWVEVNWDREGHRIGSLKSSGQWSNHHDLLFGLLVDENRLMGRKEVRAVRELFHASVMLSQNSIRDFVEPDSSETRAKVLANLAGVAHIQRSKDKAYQIVVITDRERSKLNKELSTARESVKERSKRLAELEAAHREIASRLSGPIPSLEKLMEALEDARITDYGAILGPEVMEEFLRAIQVTCAERQKELNDRNEHLAALEARFAGYKEQVTQLTKHKREERDSRARIQLLAKQYKAQVIQCQDAAKKENQLRTQINELVTTTGRLQEINALILRLSDLDEKKSATELAIEVANTEIRVAIELRDKLHRAQQVALQSHNAAGISLRKGGEELDAVVSLQSKFKRYSTLGDELKKTRDKLTGTEAELNEVSAQGKKYETDVSELTIRLNAAADRVSKATAPTDPQYSLVVKLQSLINQKDCPLCGAEYRSIDELLQASNQALQSHPARAAQSLISHHQELAARMSELSSAANLNGVAKIRLESAIKELQESIEVIAEEMSRIEWDSRKTGIELEENILSSKHSALNNRVQTLISAEKIASENLMVANNHLESYDIQVKSTVDKVDILKAERANILTTIKTVSLSVAQLGLDDPKIPSRSVVEKEISNLKDQLIELGKQRTSAEALLRKRETQVMETENEQRLLSARVEKLEKESGQLQGMIETFILDCEDSGIEANEREINKAKQILRDELKAGRLARTISTKLELSISLEKLQSERTELAEELKQAEAYANELEVKIESFGNAKHKAQSWIGPLAEQLEMSIKKTLHLHQLEIERHFRAMIPSPHAFDQIEMQVRENRLELGIRYRNQSSDIGEPYLYLSNVCERARG